MASALSVGTRAQHNHEQRRWPSVSIFSECKGIVAYEAACSGESSHFANLLAAKPRLKFEPLSSQQAGFCPSFRYLRYTRDFGPAAGTCGVSISI